MVKANYTPLFRRPSRKKTFIIVGAGIILLILLIVIIVVATQEGDKLEEATTHTKYVAKTYKNGAVAADSKECSTVGREILIAGGNAVDSAIAVMFCSSVVIPMSTGIGGGGFFVTYKRSTKNFTVYDFREQAPSAASKTMYVNKIGSSKYGGLAVGIPGEVKGLYRIHQEHGKFNWSDLVQPAINLAESGFVITKAVAKAISVVSKKIEMKENFADSLKKMLTNAKGEYLKENEVLRNPELARTLKRIQMNGSYDFYHGELAKNITRELQQVGGIITMQDMNDYKVAVRQVYQVDLNNDGDVLNTMSLPGGGPIVAMIINIMSGYKFKKLDLWDADDAFLFYQRLLESMKFAYAQRGWLGDADFLPVGNITKILDLLKNKTVADFIRENKISLDATHPASYYGGFWGKDDFGTSHLSVLAKNGDAVSVTGTINTYFGSLFRSPSTGIIFNNEMDDFSTPGLVNAYGYPPSPANFIKPGKRPLSSMSPSIITDRYGNVTMVVGASGGSRIISGTATVILKVLKLHMELGDAVASYRLHNQGVPNNTFYTKNSETPQALLDKLSEIGHTVKKANYGCVVQAIVKKGDLIYAMSDPRKGGEADGY